MKQLYPGFSSEISSNSRSVVTKVQARLSVLHDMLALHKEKISMLKKLTSIMGSLDDFYIKD